MHLQKHYFHLFSAVFMHLQKHYFHFFSLCTCTYNNITSNCFLCIYALTITLLSQVKKPNWLPWKLRNWDFLPRFLHSLSPYDYVFSCACVKDRCQQPESEDRDWQNGNGEEMKDLLSGQGRVELTPLHDTNKRGHMV